MKKNLVFGIIVGVILSFSLNIVAENIIPATQVTYNDSTVQTELDSLFDAIDINEEIVEIKDVITNLQTKINNVYPVGSIYITEKNENPSTIFGGTWERYGVGKTLLSTDGTSGQTGGSNTVTLTTNNLPSHSHSIPALSGTAASTGSGYTIGNTFATRTSNSTGSGYTISHTSSSRKTSTAGAHNHRIIGWALEFMPQAGGGYYALADNQQHDNFDENTTFIQSNGNHYHTVSDYYANKITGVESHTHKYNDYYANSISGVESHTHNVSTTASTTGSTGSGTSFSIQNPYITVYIWKRIS